MPAPREDAPNDKARAPGAWYVLTRQGRRGPFPTRQLQQYVVVGRLNPDTTEVSADGESWTPMHTLDVFGTETIRLLAGDPGSTRHVQAQNQADERSGADRRDEPDSDADAAERRAGSERRGPESETLVEARRRRPTPRQFGSTSNKMVWAAMIAALVLFASVLAYVTSPSDARAPALAIDCTAPAAPGINWTRCARGRANLAQADLARAVLVEAQLEASNLHRAILREANLNYANLRGANLQHAELGGATLQGAKLRRANLRGANLANADLRSADLTGASLAGTILDGARMDGALWVDGRRCGASSIGRCERVR